MKREMVADDFLSAAEYEKVREDKRGAIIATKKNRRMSIGPYATFYFENYDTMWLQVQEMLRIEKGGAAQLTEELHAYNPLVPKGQELVATVMLEIEDPQRRVAILSTLGDIQNCIEIRLGGETIKAVAEKDLDYTSADGKASSVQFVHFHFTPSQILKFHEADTEVMLAITHKNYGHMAVLPDHVKRELGRDFLTAV